MEAVKQAEEREKRRSERWKKARGAVSKPEAGKERRRMT